MGGLLVSLYLLCPGNSGVCVCGGGGGAVQKPPMEFCAARAGVTWGYDSEDLRWWSYLVGFEFWLCPLSGLWNWARGLWPQFPYLYNEGKYAHPSGCPSSQGGYVSP